MTREFQKVIDIELKALGVQVNNLINTIHELHKDGRNLTLIGISRRRRRCHSLVVTSTFSMAASSMKWVAKAHKVLFDKHRKTLASTIVRIQH